MLTKYIKPFFIVLILLVFIFLFKDINTYASSNIDLSEYYCETDTIYDLSDVSNINPLLDEDNNEITVDEYTDKLLGSNVSGNNSGFNLQYNVLDDDPIINVVPREYFLTTGNYFCDGDAYAYYVKTTTKYASNYLDAGNIPGTCLISDVLIIDYSSNVDEINYNFNGSYIKESLNIHQYVFYTINLNESIIFLPNIFDIIHFSVSSDYAKDNVIIPAPKFEVNEYHFSETASNLNVRSNIAYMSMENEHDSNENNGRFLVAALTKYSGYEELTTNNEKPNVYEILTNIISLGLSFSTPLDGVSTIISVYGLVGELFDLWLNKNYEYNVETSNESMLKQIKLLELSKGSQTSVYGRLIKDILYIGDTQNIKLFYEGDYIEYSFGFGCDSGEATSTTFNSTIMYDIYDDNNILQSVVHTDSFRLIDKTNKKLEVGVTFENEYNMLGTNQTYYFDSKNS